MDTATQLQELIAGIERDAYRRGINDALGEVMSAIKEIAQKHSLAVTDGQKLIERLDDIANERPRRNRSPRSNSNQSHVLDVIGRVPGMRGVDIVDILQKEGQPAPERTVRTSLGRLRRRGKIKQMQDRWYIATFEAPALELPYIVASEAESEQIQE